MCLLTYETQFQSAENTGLQAIFSPKLKEALHSLHGGKLENDHDFIITSRVYQSIIKVSKGTCSHFTEFQYTHEEEITIHKNIGTLRKQNKCIIYTLEKIDSFL